MTVRHDLRWNAIAFYHGQPVRIRCIGYGINTPGVAWLADDLIALADDLGEMAWQRRVVDNLPDEAAVLEGRRDRLRAALAAAGVPQEPTEGERS